jgi:hypothetical protein
MITIALENPECSSRPTRATGSAIKDTSATTCSRPSGKPEGGELLDLAERVHKQINKIRYVIEQVIANFKTWRIMHTDYRRPLATFPETISAVVALHFYATA